MMTKEEILNAAKKWEDFCIALRRDFHYVLWDSLPSKCKMVVF
mgnify:CR=1 FL=1